MQGSPIGEFNEMLRHMLHSSRAFIGLLLAATASFWFVVGLQEAWGQQPEGRLTGRVEVRELDETSGLVVSRRNDGVLWMHNDGASPRLYAVSKSGKHLANLDVAVVLTDVEDIAIGPGPDKDRDYLYVGDIGDNDSQRKAIRVCRVPEPQLDTTRRVHLRATEFEEFLLTLPQGAHDSEALLVDPENGDLYIITKEKKRAKVYHVAAANLVAGETTSLKLVCNIKVKKISGGDISPDGKMILLRNEGDGWLWRREPEETIVEALALRDPVEVPVRTQLQARNGESVGFTGDSQGYYTISEGKQQALCWFPTPSVPPSSGE